MDFLGNISLKLIGLICTVGVLAAVYFFIVKPAADTTTHAIDSISEPIKQAEEQARQAQDTLQQQEQSGDAQGAHTDLDRLQRCVQHANQNVNRLQNCVSRYGP